MTGRRLAEEEAGEPMAEPIELDPKRVKIAVAAAEPATADLDPEEVPIEAVRGNPVAVVPPATPAKPKPKWLRRIFWSSLGLFVVGVIVWDTWNFLVSAFAKNFAVGSALAAVTGVAVLSGAVLIFREISLFGGELRKLREVSTLTERATVLRANGGHGEGLAFASRVIEPYAERSYMKNRIAAFRGAVTSAHSDVQVLEILADKVVRPLDAQAYPMVARAARDTAMGVALSPFGLLDAGLMIWRTLGMVREVAQVYGFRPGFFGQVMLVRRILSTAATAGIGDFAGDVLVAQVGAQVGGLLSAKAGEGMLTGMRTARLGLVAMEACRPLSFAEEDRASIVRLGREIMKSKEKPGED